MASYEQHLKRLVAGATVLLLTAIVIALLIGVLFGVQWLIEKNAAVTLITLGVVGVIGFAYGIGFLVRR